MLGWYHSHPGFGVFLSEHDLFIQQNFFSNPQQVAWVFDPHTDEEGCFGWIGGNIEKLSDIRVGYSQSVEITNAGANDYNGYEDGEDDLAIDSMVRSSHNQLSRNKQRQEPEWIKWVSRAVGYTAALMVGFVLCYLFLNWRLAPVFDKAERFDQIMEIYRQYEAQHPGSFGGALGPEGLVPGGAPGMPQPSSQQQAPAQKANDQGSEKGNNAKH